MMQCSLNKNQLTGLGSKFHLEFEHALAIVTSLAYATVPDDVKTVMLYEPNSAR